MISTVMASSSSETSSASSSGDGNVNETNTFRASGLALLPITLTNLFNTPETLTTILDFQDARIGPISYDVISLFKDAFISWEEEEVLAKEEQERWSSVDLLRAVSISIAIVG